MKQTSKFISSNFSVSLLIFLAGFTLLLVQHYLFLQQTKKLKLQTENQHGRIMLGEMISNDLNKIETCFFKLPPQVIPIYINCSVIPFLKKQPKSNRLFP